MTPQSRPSIMVIECRDDRPSEIRSHLRWARGRRSLRRAERMRARRRAVVRKSLGGSPANVAVAPSQGLRVAVSRGDEPMGKFVRDELERESRRRAWPSILDVSQASPYRARQGHSPSFSIARIAQTWLCIDDVDAEFIADARACSSREPIFDSDGRSRGRRRCLKRRNAHHLDVDHRPILWGDQRGACTRTSGRKVVRRTAWHRSSPTAISWSAPGRCVAGGSTRSPSRFAIFARERGHPRSQARRTQCACL